MTGLDLRGLTEDDIDDLATVATWPSIPALRHAASRRSDLVAASAGDLDRLAGLRTAATFAEAARLGRLLASGVVLGDTKPSRTT